MRLTGLYLRSRRVGGAVVTLVLVALLAWAGTQYSLSQPSNRVEGGALIPFLVLGALAAACVVGAGAGSPFGEAERTVSRPLSPIRLGHLSGLLLFSIVVLAAALLTFDLHGARPADPTLMLLRNLAGFGGLALLTARFFGARLSWVLPLAFGIAPVFAGMRPDGSFANWAWQMKPGDDLVSWAISLALLAVGLGLVCFQGTREPADEAE